MRSVTAFITVLLCCPCISAQGLDPAAAETLFREGRDAAEAGDHARACEKFAESQRLDPAAGTLINLADCSEKLGRFARAWEIWQEALRALSASDPRRPIVAKRAKDVEQRLPRLTVDVAPGAPASIEVKRDGVALGRAAFGVALPVDAGAHLIEVVAAGRKPRRYSVVAVEASNTRLVVDAGEPEPDAEASPPPPLPTKHVAIPARRGKPERAEPDRTWGIVVTGVGAASLAAAAVTGYAAWQQKKTMEDDCVESGGRSLCGSEGLDAADRGKTFATVSTVSFFAGAALTGVGVYLLVSAKSEPARVGASFGANAAQLTLRSTW